MPRSRSRSPDRSRRSRRDDRPRRDRDRDDRSRRDDRDRSRRDRDRDDRDRRDRPAKRAREAPEAQPEAQAQPQAQPQEDFHVRANVTEANGEISCSVEEWNRVRAQLGLKPLRESGSGSDAKAAREAREREQVEENVARAERERAAAEAAKRVERARTRRLLHAKIAGPTLGDEGDEEDAAAWVERMRRDTADNVKAAREAAAASRAVADAAQAQASEGDELAGVRVGHAAGRIDSHDGVVLTLKDTSVLTEDGRGLNDGADELENVVLAEQERRERNLERARRAKAGVGRHGTGEGLLSKYDDVPEEQRATLVLDASGKVDVAQAEALRVADERLRQARDGHELVPLEFRQLEVAAAYTTPEEEAAAQAAKLKLRKRKKKKKKPARKKRESLGDLEAEGEQLGRRGAAPSAAATAQGERAAADEAGKRARYANAVTRAEDVARERLGGAEGELEEEEDDAELAATLARARRMAQLRAKAEANVDAAAAGVAAAVETAPEPALPEPGQAGLVITETTEFARSVKQSMDALASKSAAAAAAAPAPAPAPSPDAEMTDVPELPEGYGEEPEEEEQEAPGADQPLASGGLAATLALLKQTGDLSKAAAKSQTVVVGRTRDAQFDEDDDDEEGGVQLRYEDKFGRPLSKKEAWRQLNYDFHNIRPSANKLDKQRRELKRRARAAKNAGRSMAALQQHTKKKGQAHAVVGK